MRHRLGIALLLAACWTTGASGTPPAPPANDNFGSAFVLTGADVVRSSDTNAGATLQTGEDTTVAGSPAGASVWYSWTAPSNGEVVIDTASSDFDTLLGVYNGSTVDALAEVASNDDFVHPPTSWVRFAATSGTAYRIRVDGYDGANGTVHLHVHLAPPPVNDNFANAIQLTGQDATRSADTSDGATLEAGEADTVAGAGGGASIWYRWTAPVTGRATIDTATSTFDTLLGVYTGTSVDTLAEVASNDDTKIPPTSLLRFAATAGTTYRIRIDGFAEQNGTVNLHLHEVLPATSPPNDDFANAFPLSGMTTSRSADTNAGAGLEAGESAVIAGEPVSGSVWYAWTAPITGTVTLDTATSSFDTLLAVYTGTAVTSLSNVGSNDDTSTDLTSRVKFQANVGVTYRIRVDGYSGDSGTIELHLDEVLAPANDDFANAYILSGVETARLGDTNLGASLQPGEATAVAGQSADSSAWYYWTAPQSTAVTIDTAGSDFDTLLGVYTGSAVNTLAEVASNDNAGTGDQTSLVSFPITAGTVYRIRVDGVHGTTGTIDLRVVLARVSDMPTDVTAIPQNGAVDLSWTTPASNGGSPITGYEITEYVNGTAQSTTSTGNVNATTITGLTNGTAYSFRVAAINVVGTGPLSDPSNDVTPRTVPDAPANVTATGGAGQATLSWTIPASDGGSPITGYVVTRYAAGVALGTSNVGIGTHAAIGGLTNGTTYTFRVAARNAAGTGAQSSDSNAVTPRTIPDAPSAVSGIPGSAQVTVSWIAPTVDGGSPVTGYDVTRYVAGVAQGTTSVGAVTQATVTGLVNGTPYTFRIAAKNVVGTGAQSASSTAITPRTVPDAPTSAAAVVSGAGKASVTWSAPAFDGGNAISGYDVTSYAGGTARGTISVGAVTQATFAGLANGTTYTFRVSAKNAAGTGAQSADSNTVSPATPKLTLTVTKSGTGSGTVTGNVGGLNCGAVCTVDLDSGTRVTLEAAAGSGSMFAGWSGPCSGIGSCTVTLDTAKSVSATFDPVPQQQQQQSSGSQPANACVVPNVKRKPLAAAKRLIAKAHCALGKVTKTRSSVMKGSVVSQKQKPGKRLAAGTKIALVVSRGK